MTDTLEVRIPRSRSEAARAVLERIAWRGYIPPEADTEAEAGAEVAWQLPVDQVDLIQSVLKRNRRLAGEAPPQWKDIDRVCEAIAAESRRTGKRPNYGPEDFIR